MTEQKRIMIAGTVETETKTFDGVVQAIFEDRGSKPRRWRITMLDIE